MRSANPLGLRLHGLSEGLVELVYKGRLVSATRPRLRNEAANRPGRSSDLIRQGISLLFREFTGQFKNTCRLPTRLLIGVEIPKSFNRRHGAGACKDQSHLSTRHDVPQQHNVLPFPPSTISPSRSLSLFSPPFSLITTNAKTFDTSAANRRAQSPTRGRRTSLRSGGAGADARRGAGAGPSRRARRPPRGHLPGSRRPR